jgi:late competence protein required for DNA uptake (superfamily II DNA/RNA helicase)
MKLLIITAIRVFEKEIKHILKKSDIKIFSFANINGFRDTTEESVESNWFASEMNQNESILVYAFATQEKTELVFKYANEFNETQKTLSKIHVVVLNVEKSN